MSRAQQRWEELLQLISARSYSSIQAQISAMNVLIDIGGEQGDFAHIVEAQGPKYCVEVQHWYSRTHEQIYPDVQYKYVTTASLPFDSAYADFVSIIQVLHHLDNPYETLRQIYRVLKPAGLQFIREHDCSCEEDKLTIDIEHQLYEAVLNKNMEFVSTYQAQYFSQRYLFQIVSDAGFELVNHSVPVGLSKGYQTLFRKKSSLNTAL